MIEEKLIKELIKSRVKTPEDLSYFKRKMAKKYKILCPSNIELLKTYHKLVKNKTLLRQGYGGQGIKKSGKLENLLITRPVRSLSGIVNISVLTKPYPCPGKCLYCPNEKGIPKSYVSGEPAVERAKRLNFNPYLQVKKRIEMLELEGHPTNKIELRVVGGTWSYYPKKYQEWFIARCFQACNEAKLKVKKQKAKVQVKIKKLLNEQKKNEAARHRIVGLSVETRPDFINAGEIKRLREFGVTMVELGAQSIYDDVLKKNLRGHTIKETILATKLLKDAGFKVLYQMMPNLLGSSLKKDEKMFEELFKNPDFQPDLLKIYPCALLGNAPLHRLYKAGKYKPYTEKQLIILTKSIKKRIPPYVRIQRITRDIPSKDIIAGPAQISNLRQVLAQDMKQNSWRCNCIRCREVKEDYNSKEKIFLFREDYNSSDGKEIFLSYENKDRTKLYSLLRLRLTENSSLPNLAIIRELHTFGQQLPIVRGFASNSSPQHKGLGRKLVKEAAKIAKKESASRRIAIISGVGVRDYFRKLGYKLKDTYMVKDL